MAKQTKTETTQGVPTTTGKTLAETAAERAKVSAKDRFTFKKDLEKGAPQAKNIVNILKAAGAKGLTRAELVQKMDGVVVTRQPLGRILSYYQKDLHEAGAIEWGRAAA